MTRQRIVAVARWLPQIARLQIEARPENGSRTNWRGQGHATVEARRDADGDWLFHETGRMRLLPDPTAVKPAGSGNRALSFRNVLRWHVAGDWIDLAHQRFGAAHEVGLVRLGAALDHDAADLVSARPHPCRADRYHARLYLVPDGFDLHWRVQGPEKSELLVHAYRREPPLQETAGAVCNNERRNRKELPSCNCPTRRSRSWPKTITRNWSCIIHGCD